MKDLWLLEVRYTDCGGGLILRSIHETIAGARKALTTYCKNRWKEFEPEDRHNPFYRGRFSVTKYFDLMDPDEVFEIEKMQVQP